MTSLALGPKPITDTRRSILHRRVRWIVAATITYNVLEAIIALTAGTIASSSALIGFGLLLPVIGPATMGISFAAIAGIMVFISLDELLPTAEETGEHHHAIYGLIAGMAVMAVSLMLFM